MGGRKLFLTDLNHVFDNFQIIGILPQSFEKNQKSP
jgi:hypothetical protein